MYLANPYICCYFGQKRFASQDQGPSRVRTAAVSRFQIVGPGLVCTLQSYMGPYSATGVPGNPSHCSTG